MTVSDLIALTPFLVVAGMAVLILVVVAFRRNHALTAALTFGALIAGLVTLPAAYASTRGGITAVLVVDGYGLLIMGLVLGATAAVSVLSYAYLEGGTENPEEYYVLLLCACLGSMIVVCSSHFASFFLGLELLNVSLYALIAYTRVNVKSLEAGLKYLIPAAASDAFLLFGMALLYCETGTMEFVKLQEALVGQTTLVSFAGLAMLFLGMGFKLALVPFHMWVGDVYQGAPAPVTAFVATVSKGAVFALLFRYFRSGTGDGGDGLFVLFSVIAVASMFVGNLLALLQDNVKRLLAYSSVAHLGYLLVAFLAGGQLAIPAVLYYLAAYFVTTLGAFGVIAVLSDTRQEADDLTSYRGLAWRRPALAAVFTGMLLSLAGIPVTAGFIGKFYVVAAGVGTARWLLVTMLIVNSVIGLFYYVRAIAAMYAPPDTGPSAVESKAGTSWTAQALLAVLACLLLWLGLYPPTWLEVIETLVVRL